MHRKWRCRRQGQCTGFWAIDEDARRNPTRVPGLEGAIQVATGGGHSCAITADGAVYCWGGNNSGQLGDGTQGPGTARDVPQPVLGLTDRAARLALAHRVSCAILVSGEVYCWGDGDDGVLGNGNLETQNVAAKVPDVENVVDMDIQDHGCAVRANGTIACWGYDTFLPGGGLTNDIVPTPVLVDGISDVVDIAVGFWFMCALTASQEIYCWGANGDHELGLGDGSPYWVDVPTRVDWRAALQ